MDKKQMGALISHLMREFRSLQFLLLLASIFLRLDAAENGVAPSSAQSPAELALKRFHVAEGLKAEVFAAEPLLANPVSFTFDERGRVYVVETHRRRTSVYDIRNHPDWLEKDLSFRTVLDRSNFLQTVLTPENKTLPPKLVRDLNGDGQIDARDLQVESERIRLLEDLNGDGKADRSVTYADGFNTTVSGVAAGILTRHGKVWFTCIPDLWMLQDTNDNGHADLRTKLLTGFGVHISFGGHDLHGLKFGPDGKLYFSIADRGMHVETAERIFENPDSGAIMRCNPDGSDFEVIATGLRNPQELAFDEFGNLWTGDNNGDGGDKARWIWVLEGMDAGWRIGWQHLPKLGAWNSEKLWELPPRNTAAYILPPVAHIGHGPAGLAYYPGTGLPARYAGHFFLCDFPGGVNSFAVKPKGAGFEIADLHEFFGGLYPVDVEFGFDGGAYVADWIEGWEKTGKGRIYRVFDQTNAKDPASREVRRVLTEGFEQRTAKELVQLLDHADMRVRQEAQFTLAERGPSVTNALVQAIRKNNPALARIHAIWTLGQLGREQRGALAFVVPLLADPDAEIRAQAARVLGDDRYAEAADDIANHILDPSPRVRLMALLAIARLKHQPAIEQVVRAIRENNDSDPFLRHAGVMALTALNDLDALAAAGKDEQSSMRLATLLAMRRIERPEVASFLYDSDPQLVLEAARAIHDVPIERGLSQLAALLPKAKQTSEAVVKRSINANLIVGKFENALMLAEYAAGPENPPVMRADALEALSYWAEPPGRDRVLGTWRPVPAHEARGATLALRSDIPKLISEGPETVRVAAVKAGVRLKMEELASVLFQQATAESSPSAVRVEAIRGLEAFKDKRLPQALESMAAAKDAGIRKEAAKAQGRAPSAAATNRISRLLEAGSVGEKQAAFASLTNIPPTEAAPILTNWLERLVGTGIAPELMLDVLEAARGSTNPAVKSQLSRYESSLPKEDPLAPYRECLYGGDAQAGQRIFFERAEAACLRCHKIKGEGGEVGPELTGLGARRDRRYILESVVFPNRQIAQGFESVLLALKDGRSFAGIIKSETDGEIVLNSPEDGILKINKAEVKSRERGLSPMPAEIATILSRRDLRDLVEFLAGQK